MKFLKIKQRVSNSGQPWQNYDYILWSCMYLKKPVMIFDYLVGAKVKGFDTSVKITENAPIIILEGDEYLASPINRESKFLVL
jgi:hypothetical protein